MYLMAATLTEVMVISLRLTHVSVSLFFLIYHRMLNELIQCLRY